MDNALAPVGNVSLSNLHRIEIFPDESLRGGSTFDLRDDMTPRTLETLFETPWDPVKQGAFPKLLE